MLKEFCMQMTMEVLKEKKKRQTFVVGGEKRLVAFLNIQGSYLIEGMVVL
jgi:hypothetical protein